MGAAAFANARAAPGLARPIGAHDLPSANPPGLSTETAALVAQLLQRLQDQEQQLTEHGCVLAQRDQALAERDALLQRKDREIALREAKIEEITFELARLKRWKFGARSEAMNAEQRRLFEETMAEDEAGLREQLERLRREAAMAAAGAAASNTTTKAPPRRPRRIPFLDHLRRVEHHHAVACRARQGERRRRSLASSQKKPRSACRASMVSSRSGWPSNRA